jgi:hypothetical protein
MMRTSQQGIAVSEPSTAGASAVSLAIATLGPVAGPYSLIVMSALAGAMWPLKTMESPSRAQGAWFLLRIVATAVFIAGAAAHYIEVRFALPAYEALSVASFGIGAMGNSWTKVISALRDGLLHFITKGKSNE